MIQIPSLDWPRRTNALTGSEDLLKQNPLSDSFPQEERLPVSLVSTYTLSQLSFVNVGTGIGVFDFKNNGQVDLRKIDNASNKVTLALSNKTLFLDVNSTNIASEISITDLNGIPSPTASNQYLMWNGSSYEFNSLSPYALTIENELGQQVNLSSGDTLTLFGTPPIGISKNGSSRFDISLNAGLNHLNDVTISGPVPNNWVLGYNTLTSQWIPKPPSAASPYTFSIIGDDAVVFTIFSGTTLSLLGAGNISTSNTGTNELTIDWTAELSDLSNVSTIPPSNNYVLTYNSTSGEWEPKVAQGTTVLAGNGLTKTVNTIKLGGTLSEITTINGDNYAYPLTLLNLQKLEYNTKRNDENFTFQSNTSLGITELKAQNQLTSANYKLVLDSTNSFASIETQVGSSTKKFKLKNSVTQAGLFYELSGNAIAGFFAEEDQIKVLDGVNTPVAGHVLTYMSDGTSQFQPVSSGGGGGDDWGNQVVAHDTTLTGDGTSGNTLKVAIPVPAGYTDGDYLAALDGDLIWTPFPQKELIGLCEVERESEVSVLDGKLFFVVNSDLSGWQIKNYTAATYILGSGGTTTIELIKNGVVISGSNVDLTTQSATKTNINHTVLVGDRISVKVSVANKTTKDKGLSLTLLLSPP